MKLLKKFCCIPLLAICLNGNAESGDYYLNNRYPLLKKNYIELPLGTIEAKGWLKEQLLLMKNGLTGNLDKFYPQVMGPRNGWLGGDGDVWERGPYWIDGLLPLAYILNDSELIDKVKPWIEWTLSSQDETGYFGPATDRGPERGLQRNNSHDWWPKMVMLKVLQQYYTATEDERVIDFLTKYFKYQLSELPNTPLGHWTFWGEQRGGDNLQIVYWLYNITGDSFLLDLAKLIHKQTFNWTDAFWSGEYFNRQLGLHCVNVAQGFKEPAVYFQQSKDYRHLQSLKEAVKNMRNTIGLPTGLWGGDELLRFGTPTAGSELCTAVEMMYSLEEILEITGDVYWADYLERIAYNVLPTQVTDDFSARQYYQQLNQIMITREWREFSTPHTNTDLLYGLLTGYPCCTSNMHQGWPKFTQNLWYATSDNGVAALLYAPSKVTLKVANETDVSIVQETAYPFEDRVNFNVSFVDKSINSVYFPFHFRVPGWCKKPIVTINGKEILLDTYPGNIGIIKREWNTGDRLSIEFPADIEVSQWYGGGAVVERGPLLYSLKMDEKWTKNYFKEEDDITSYGNWYYEVKSETPWNFALSTAVLDREKIPAIFTLTRSSRIAKYPWNLENAPIKIETRARRLKNWKAVNGSVGPIAYYNQFGNDMEKNDEIIELIPYGCTTLRITEFPLRYY